MNTIEKNKKITRRFYDEVLIAGNLGVIDELVADNYREHEELPGVEPNKNGLKDWVKMTRNAFPDFKVEILDIVAEDDKVVVMGKMKGTHQGEFMGKKGTGRKLDLPFVDVILMKNGKAIEHWGYSDNLKMMEQLQLDLTAVHN